MTASEWSTGPDGVPGPALEQCLRAAVSAPSIHNSQPWLFRIRSEQIDVLADIRRRLAVADPDGRELMVSVGAALLNLRLAIQARGRGASVQLLPDPGEPALAAIVSLGRDEPPSAEVLQLATAIPLRQTNRRPYGSMRVRGQVLAALEASASTEGATLQVCPGEEHHPLLALTAQAEGALRASQAYRDELAEWTATSRGRPDGVPPVSFGPRPELAAMPVRDFDPQRTRTRSIARFERQPTLAVLYTDGDQPADWLLAGQALERVLLTATAHGVATALMTQVVEVPDLRRAAGAPRPGLVAQSMLRLGYASRVRPAPRRPLDDVLVVQAPGDRDR
jgi:nitroreductase